MNKKRISIKEDIVYEIFYKNEYITSFALSIIDRKSINIAKGKVILV